MMPLEAVFNDVRFALRSYARRPFITATIVTVLALGIGANSALFSVIQAFTVRPAPGVPADPTLVRVYGLQQENRGAARQLRDLSHRELDALTARKETFATVAAWMDEDVVVEGPNASSARGTGAEYVTSGFWRTLGVSPAVGPGLSTVAGSAEFATVLSAPLAEELFGTPASAVGARILVNGMPVQVVGVAPKRFQGAVPHREAPALWLPLETRAHLAKASPRWLTDSARVSVFARLAPGVSEVEAGAVAQRVASVGAPALRASDPVFGATVGSLWGQPPVLGPDNLMVGFVAMGIVAILILLVACTNVSSLLVALAVGRRHEIAVRLSLGASRARLIRQLITESAMLSVAGGVAGLVVYWALTTFAAARLENINVDIAPDFTTIAFTMALAIGTGLLFGLSPALHATRGHVAAALRDSGAGGTARSRLQRFFVGAQIVFSQPLLVMLALMLATLMPTGPSMLAPVEASIVSARFRPVREDAGEVSRRQSLDRVVARVVQDPSVIGVVAEPAAFSIANVAVPEGTPPARMPVEGTAPGYFRLIGVPILLGRDVSFEDTAATEVRVVVANNLARQLWGDENPLGKTIATRSRTGLSDTARLVVIGVYDAAVATTRGEDRMYTSYRGRWRSDALLIRTRGAATRQVPALRDQMRSAAPELPMESIETLTEVNGRSRREGIQVAGAAVGAGALALLLASIGLFAVVSLAVGQRRREIGIRIALGGSPKRVAAMFFASGVRLSAIGMLAGLPVSAAAARIAISQGVLLLPELNLKLIGLAIAAVVLIVASAASWFPARRAALVDPSLTLRSD